MSIEEDGCSGTVAIMPLSMASRRLPARRGRWRLCMDISGTDVSSSAECEVVPVVR
jgi:hypothetical protein